MPNVNVRRQGQAFYRAFARIGVPDRGDARDRGHSLNFSASGLCNSQPHLDLPAPTWGGLIGDGFPFDALEDVLRAGR